MKNKISCLQTHKFIIALLVIGVMRTATAQSFDQIDLQVSLNINWGNNPGQTETALGMGSTADTWKVRFTIFGNPLPVSTNCSGSTCSSSVFSSQLQGGKIKSSIQSSTEPDLSQTPFNYHAFRSLDEFEYYSDGSGGNPDYLGITDVINGIYIKPGGNQLESWLLERSVLGTNLSGAIQANSQALIQFLNSGNATFEVQENFLNHLQQVSYGKIGTATVTNVIVITAQNNPYPLECTYEVASDWGNGYQSNVKLKNVSNSPVGNWLVKLKFDNDVYINNFWGTSMTGYIPDFVATSLSWNETIYPDQEVNFGFVGSKAPSQNANAVISGKLCR